MDRCDWDRFYIYLQMWFFLLVYLKGPNEMPLSQIITHLHLFKQSQQMYHVVSVIVSAARSEKDLHSSSAYWGRHSPNKACLIWKRMKGKKAVSMSWQMQCIWPSGFDGSLSTPILMWGFEWPSMCLELSSWERTQLFYYVGWHFYRDHLRPAGHFLSTSARTLSLLCWIESNK